MIRVLRVLEYEYENAEYMTRDMNRWYIGANGVRSHPHMTIRSAIMIPHEDASHIQQDAKLQAVIDWCDNAIENHWDHARPMDQVAKGILKLIEIEGETDAPN